MTTTLTHGGVTAKTRTAKGELFTTAVSTLGERIGRSRAVYGGAYEDPTAREARLRELVKTVGTEDPRWMLAFIQWLREEGQLRTVSQTVACVFVKERLKAKVPDDTGAGVPGFNRTAINVACGRATDMGELLDYWTRTYGRNIPPAVKRGIADATRRLVTERSALRGDGQRQDWRLGDVIELTHPRPETEWQSALYGWLLDRRHGRKETSAGDLAKLPTITAHESFSTMRAVDPIATRNWLLEDPARIREAGLSWEDVAGLGKMDARAWEAVIPFMGYLALLRNLRNFELAGVSPEVLVEVQKRLEDTAEIERADLFPIRFYAAARELDTAVGSTNRWDETLEKAVNHSLLNVPALEGHTLVLVDVSGSMYNPMSGHSGLKYHELAQLFGTALAMRCERANLVQFDHGSRELSFIKYPMGQVLKTMKTFTGGGSTDTYGAVKRHLRTSHTRVVIVTDEQATTAGSIQKAVGAERPLYIFNVAGYAPTLTTEKMPLHKGFGGLTDQAFRLIPLAESGVAESWPFRY